MLIVVAILRVERTLAELADSVGFAMAGAVAAEPHPDAAAFRDWAGRGLAGEMGYLTDHRAGVRGDPRELLSSARSVVCVAKAYHGPEAYSTRFDDRARGWISRYAWAEDYHAVVRRGLEALAGRMTEVFGEHEWRACVDTAPLLERSYARSAGLGWIGRNQCLIDERWGSWFFLGVLLTSLELREGAVVADRCGTCRRCIDACPTRAIVPNAGAPGGWELDSRLCISYLTIELRGGMPVELREGVGRHLFGCDICQDVCPWNERLLRGPVLAETEARAGLVAPPLGEMAALTPEEFQGMFRGTPVTRARYHGFLRNVAVAMGNSGLAEFRGPLEKLAAMENAVVAEHARWALGRLG